MTDFELDDDGHPTDETLTEIETWGFKKGYEPLMEQLHYLMTPYGKCYKEVGSDKWCIATGGWSGNESIIASLYKNILFWKVCWLSSKRGGYYEFEIKALK